MENLHAATLHISLQSSQVYRLLYTVHNGRRGAAIPYLIHGQEQLRALLHQFVLETAVIDIIIARVEAAMSYVLTLDHIDRATAEGVLRSFSP
jgi:hypothetical protein